MHQFALVLQLEFRADGFDMGLGRPPADPKCAGYFPARVTGSCQASDLILARSERPRGWLRRDHVAGRGEGPIASATKEAVAAVVAVSDSYVKHAVTVDVGSVQALGVAAELVLERATIQASFCPEEDQELRPRRDHRQVGDAIHVEVCADDSEGAG